LDMSTKILLQPVSVLESGVVDWKVFTAWVETEGSIASTVDFKLNPRTGTYYARIVRAILISQNESAPLEALQLFLERQGVFSLIRLIKPSKTAFGKKPYYRLEIQRVEDIDKVVENIRDYLLTTKTRKQLEFYLRTRHMTSAELREGFLQVWLESRRIKKRRGRKGQYVY